MAPAVQHFPPKRSLTLILQQPPDDVQIREDHGMESGGGGHRKADDGEPGSRAGGGAQLKGSKARLTSSRDDEEGLEQGEEGRQWAKRRLVGDGKAVGGGGTGEGSTEEGGGRAP